MQRRRISSKIRMRLAIVLTVSGSLFILYIVGQRWIADRTAENALPLVILFVSYIFVYFGFFRHDKIVEFDDNYLYITDRQSEERIPLKNITTVDYTSKRLNAQPMWRIVYADAHQIK